VTLIQRLIARLGYEIQTGHPCLYDALDIASSDVNPQSYLEVGVSDGASLLTVIAASPGLSRIVVCDLWKPVEGGSGRGSHAHISKLLEDVHYGGGCWFLDGDSRTLLPTIPPSPLFDLATVDGNHSAEGASSDLACVWPLLRSGGILVMDDVDRPHLRAVWDAFVAANNVERIYELNDGANWTAIARKREAA